MTQYLVAIHHPDDYDPSAEDEAMSRDICALNDEQPAAKWTSPSPDTCGGSPFPDYSKSRCGQ